ncbi:substrate-binding periplasmic protein [Thalassotalea sediminis]|uniref:substrate-binding periplasmic protein n=1 Tax=Thalassotalea sediminis TaxID=1759089 RepID=UPI002573DC06|nr:transporter substrate-binding domain-containing protein [Thalassotalea sediminis]
MKCKMLITFISTLLICLTACANQRNNLSVGWELWYPYQYHNNQHLLVGLDVDIFNRIIEKADYKVDYTELPWKRHLQYIKLGKMDVAMGASISSERQNYAYFTQPYRTEQVKLYVRKGMKDKIILPNLRDLIASDYLIGVESGYYYGETYKTLMKQPAFQAHISEVIDLEQNVKLTLKGHLDGFFVDPVTMRAFIDKYKLFNEFEAHSVEIYQDDIYIMLSKKTMNEKDLERFNSAIEHLKQTGELDQISQQWTSVQMLKR